MKRSRKIRFIIYIVLLIIGLVTLFLMLKPNFKTDNLKEKIVVNYKDKYKNIIKVCYGNEFKCEKIKPKIEGKVDTTKIGKYNIKYTYKYKDKTYTFNQVVVVKDIESPILEIEDKKISVCPNGKIQDFKYKITDNYDKEIKELKKSYDKESNKVIITAFDSSKNKTIKKIDAIVEDKTGPVIQINGGETKTFTQGFEYKDEGATVIDNCDDNIKLETSSDLNTNSPGTYHITYSAKDSSGNESKVQRTINIKSVDSGYRVVYLTFDDGPSEYTYELLDILKKYNVKVTFFVTGRGPDDAIVRAYQEGHKIALHTNTHDYSYVYSSINNYYSDLYAVQDRVKRLTGESPNIIRFPGGSSNTVSINYDGGTHIMSTLVNDVQNKGFHYFDWNVSSGDGGSELPTETVYNNVISALKEETSIVLQHDTKKWSIDAVPKIIEYCQSNGYTFKTITDTTYGAHHGTNN